MTFKRIAYGAAASLSLLAGCASNRDVEHYSLLGSYPVNVTRPLSSVFSRETLVERLENASVAQVDEMIDSSGIVYDMPLSDKNISISKTYSELPGDEWSEDKYEHHKNILAEGLRLYVVPKSLEDLTIADLKSASGQGYSVIPIDPRHDGNNKISLDEYQVIWDKSRVVNAKAEDRIAHGAVRGYGRTLNYLPEGHSVGIVDSGDGLAKYYAMRIKNHRALGESSPVTDYVVTDIDFVRLGEDKPVSFDYGSCY